MTDLSKKKCKPLAKGTPALDQTTVSSLINQLSGNWLIASDGKMISCEYSFKNYYQTIAFVNAIAWIVHQEDHHPDLLVSYNKCTVNYSTHSTGGLSENDFICAAKIDEIL